LLIGVALLLASQKIIDFDIIWKLMFPSILIIIGFSLMFKSSRFNREIEKVKKYKNEDDGYYATFSSQNLSFDNEEFKGAEISAIFGGIKLDLRDAIIKGDVIIDATAIFGGIDILAPKDIKVKIKSLPIFGGASNKTINSKNENAHTIYINSTTIFGGLDIK
jgi:predicted membrane protein